MIGRALPAGARLSSTAGLSVRSLRARPLRAALTAGAIVLGVGMVFGVLLLVATIHTTFHQLYDGIYGRTDLVVSGQNSAGALPASTIERVRAVPGVDWASGNVYAVFRTIGADGRADRGRDAQLYVAGTDYDQPNPTTAEMVQGRDPAAPREIAVAADWARSHDVRVGDTIRLSTPTGRATLDVTGLFEFSGGVNLGGYGTASMPIAGARALTDKRDTWDEIAVGVDGGADVDAVLARLQRALGGGVEVATPDTKSAEADEQLSSLDVVLYFFSGIALFVGGFLILNSFNMTVLQRMRELGTLRALGASRRRVAWTILVEALLLGVVGTVVGLGVGVGLALLLVQAMKTFGLPIGDLDFGPGSVIAAVIVGLLATVVGASWPALRASRIPPIRSLLGMSTDTGRPGLRRAIAGLALFLPSLLGSGLLWFGGSTNAWIGILAIAATMGLFVGMVLLSPFVVLPVGRLLSRPLGAVMPAEGRLAADALNANPRRTAATAATLLVALSVVVVNATMASSFVGSINDQFDRLLARDVTVQGIGYSEYGPPLGAWVTPQLRAQISDIPGVEATTGRRSLWLKELPGSSTQGLIVGVDPATWATVDRPQFEDAGVQQALRGLAAGGVAPARTYADDAGLQVGDTVRLAGPAGTRTAPVVAIADTFDNGGDVLQMSSRTMAAVYGVQHDAQLGIKVADGADAEAVAARIDALLARDYPGFEALSNAQVKRQVSDQITQQFGLFNSITAIAVVVGLLGVINTLSMSVLERTREIGVLRALGATRWRVRRMLGDESLLLSVSAAVAGLVAGLLVASVWILSMQRSSVPGLQLHLPFGTLVTVAVIGVAVGVVAAIVPARRAAKLQPLTALRYE
jgi:putative ABC transport system permease protein